jgi:hypothetical protein
MGHMRILEINFIKLQLKEYNPLLLQLLKQIKEWLHNLSETNKVNLTGYDVKLAHSSSSFF